MPDGFLTDITTCVQRYWDENKRAYHDDEMCGDGIDRTEDKEVQAMCKSCLEVDHLVQERKKAKHKFGIAKRRLSALGKGLLK